MITTDKRKIALKLNFLMAALLIGFSSVISSTANESNTATAKFGEWNIVGPSGGDVRVVAVDPKDKDRLYISTLDGQIHTSADGGTTWRLLANLNRPQLVLTS